MVRVLELNDGPVRARLERLSVSKANWNGATPEGQRTRQAITSLFHAIDGLEMLAFWILVEGVDPNLSISVLKHFESLLEHLASGSEKQRGDQSLHTQLMRFFGTKMLLPVVDRVAAFVRQAKKEARSKHNKNWGETWVALQVQALNASLKPRVPVTPEMFKLIKSRREEPKEAACRIVAAISGGIVKADDLYNGEARFRGRHAVRSSPRRKATRTSK